MTVMHDAKWLLGEIPLRRWVKRMVNVDSRAIGNSIRSGRLIEFSQSSGECCVLLYGAKRTQWLPFKFIKPYWAKNPDLKTEVDNMNAATAAALNSASTTPKMPISEEISAVMAAAKKLDCNLEKSYFIVNLDNKHLTIYGGPQRKFIAWSEFASLITSETKGITRGIISSRTGANRARGLLLAHNNFAHDNVFVLTWIELLRAMSTNEDGPIPAPPIAETVIEPTPQSIVEQPKVEASGQLANFQNLFSMQLSPEVIGIFNAIKQSQRDSAEISLVVATLNRDLIASHQLLAEANNRLASSYERLAELLK